MELLKDLFRALDIVALERIQSGRFQLIGSLPGWFVRLYPESMIEDRFDFGHKFLFLENFLIDAEKFWKTDDIGRLRSGVWVEVDAFGKERKLEASALNISDRKILLIEFPGSTFDEKQSLIQKGREQKLDLRTQKKIKRNLQTTESRYKALLQLVPETLLFLNDAGICVDSSGEKATEYLGQNITSIFPEKAGTELLELAVRAMEKDTIETLAFQVQGRRYRAQIASSGPKEALLLIREEKS